MIRSVLTLLLASISFPLLSQSNLVTHGPFLINSMKSLYGSNDRIFITSTAGTIWYTDDRVTWKHPADQVNPVSNIIKDRDGNLYAYNLDGVFWKSVDNGDSWSEYEFRVKDDKTGTVQNAERVISASISKDTLFFATNMSLGYTVTENPEGRFFHRFFEDEIVAVAVDHNLVVAAEYSTSMHFSTDRGATWTTRTTPFSCVAGMPVLIVGKKIFVNSNNVWYTEDLGATWTKIDGGPTGDIISVGGQIYGVGQGVYSLSEDNQWTRFGSINNNFKVSIAGTGDHIFVVTKTEYRAIKGLDDGHFHETIDRGSNWNSIPVMPYTDARMSNLFLDSSDSALYASNNLAVLYKKPKGQQYFSYFINNSYGGLWFDTERIWVPGGSVLYSYTKNGIIQSSLNSGGKFQNANRVVKSDSRIFVSTGGYGVWLTTIYSGGFEDFSNGLSQKYIIDLKIQDNKLYALNPDGLYRTGTNKADWQNLYSTTTSDPTLSFCINQNTIIISGRVNVLSTDGGVTWNEVDLHDTLNDIKYANGKYYGAAEGKVYMSSDGGHTWLARSIGSDYALNNLTIVPTKSSIYVGTAGMGIWSFKNRGPQTITFDGIENKVIGDAPFVPNASSSEGFPVTFVSDSEKISISSSNEVTLIEPGRVEVEAKQDGNDWVDAADPVFRSFCINPSKPTISVGGTIEAPELISSNDEGNQWYLDGVAIDDAIGKTFAVMEDGMYTVNSTTDDCSSELSEEVQVTQGKQVQTLSFAELETKKQGDDPFMLSATTSSGLPVTFSTTSDKITIDDVLVTILKAGRATITAKQNGNDTYAAATPVDRSFCINPAKPEILIGGDEGSVLTSDNGTGNQWYVDGTLIPDATDNVYEAAIAGSYTVKTTIDDCVSEMSEAQVVTVTTVTGLEENADHLIKLFPNPAATEVHLHTPSPADITMIDVMGRVIDKRSTTLKEERFSVESLNRGVYYFRIKMNDRIVVRNFVKL